MFKIYNEDCLQTMERIYKAGGKVDVILTSPPYNTGRNSGNIERGRDNYERRYDIYLEERNQDEYTEWTIDIFNHYDSILKRYAVKRNIGNKSFLLKSPDSTSHVYFLKQKYPDAKFINIYRNPYTLIRSTVHLFSFMFKQYSFQYIPKISFDVLHEQVLFVCVFPWYQNGRLLFG